MSQLENTIFKLIVSNTIFYINYEMNCINYDKRDQKEKKK